MNLKDFIESVAQYVGEYLSKKFTGKIIFTLNLREGGIANVNVTVDHVLTKPSPE